MAVRRRAKFPGPAPEPRDFPGKNQSTKGERTHCFLAFFAYIALQTRKAPGSLWPGFLFGPKAPFFQF